jgi:hypothetical protein
MSKVAILVGFGYQHCDDQYKLLGVTYDLFTAYQHALITKCDKILVITDMSPDLVDNLMIRNIVLGKVSDKITTFYKELKEQGRLYLFINLDDMRARIVKLGTNAARIIFYYSGHAHHGTALVPKYRHSASYESSVPVGIHMLDLVDIVSYAISVSRANSETVFIADCCNSNGLRLPFTLNVITKTNRTPGGLSSTVTLSEAAFADTIRLATRTQDVDLLGHYRLEKLNNWFAGKRIVCISSSTTGSTTFTSPEGSKFTVELFKYLSNENINTYTSLLTILTVTCDEDIVGKVTKPQIRSTHPDSYLIQPWIKKPGLSSVYYEKMISCIVIRQ